MGFLKDFLKFIFVDEKKEAQREIGRKFVGDKYELQIGAYYKKQGYKIFYNGLNKGKKDGGIDLICYKRKEALLIQCKNWRKQVNQDNIRKFIGDCYIHIRKNERYLKNKNIRKIFVSSNGNLSIATRLFLRDNKNEVEFKHIEYK
ncbi:restriction endonuclease [Campylobacter sputorum]|uniref:restriction endonuclease n=1 Tax=Campylobacter sputorum TaxID=206 RepID=UPI00053BF1AA|nr:restriction endonuclease [Campylobacter sputorum]